MWFTYPQREVGLASFTTAVVHRRAWKLTPSARGASGSDCLAQSGAVRSLPKEFRLFLALIGNPHPRRRGVNCSGQQFTVEVDRRILPDVTLVVDATGG
jgi:hypothetical protein